MRKEAARRQAGYKTYLILRSRVYSSTKVQKKDKDAGNRRKTHTTFKHTHTQKGQNNIEKRDKYSTYLSKIEK